MRAAAVKAAEERAKAAEEAERMAEEGGEGGRGPGPGRGMGPGMRGGFGEGARGGMGMGEIGGMKTKDGVLVIPPMEAPRCKASKRSSRTSWVTVLAKVPIKQQFQMYEDALATRGFNPAADEPQYIGYVIERAGGHRRGDGQPCLAEEGDAEGDPDRMATWPIQTPIWSIQSTFIRC